MTIVRVASTSEAAATLAQIGGPLRFRGGGTKQTWEHEPQAATFVATDQLTRVLVHEPDDFTVTVQAGLAFADLQAGLALKRQWVPLDPPTADAGATVGGILSADEAGPRRHRHGTMRDLVTGVTVVLGDGTAARSGGRVIKNVAGYDLSRLFCGAFGTLGLVTEVSLRLAPLPAASRTLRVPCSPAEAAGLLAALPHSRSEPAAVEWHAGALFLRIEGEALPERLAPLRLAAEAAGLAHDTLAGSGEASAWIEAARPHAAEPGHTTVRVAALPDRFAAVHDAVRVGCGHGASVASHAGLGLHTVTLGPGTAATQSACLSRLAQAVTGLGGHLRLRRLADGVTAPDLPVPPAAAAMSAVKAALDPEGRCEPGRLPWLQGR